MRGKTLGIAFGIIALFAFWPTLVWLGAQFTLLGDRWFATGGAITYTFPIALALAAVVLAVHGMLLNAELADSLEEQFAADPVLPADFELRVPVGATAAAAPATVAAPRMAAPAGADGAETVELAVDAEAAEDAKPKLGGKVAVRDRPKSYQADGGDGSKKSKKVKKVGRQVKQRAGYKAKHTIIRSIRERIGLRF